MIGGGDWGNDRIIPDCVRALISRKKIPIRNPEHVRPFQYILDPINGMLKLSQKMWNEPAFFSTSWNMGPENSKDVIQVKQLVNEVIKKWGYGEWQDVCTLNDEAKHEAKLLMLDSSKSKKKTSISMPMVPPTIIIKTKVAGIVKIALPPIWALTTPTLTIAKK